MQLDNAFSVILCREMVLQRVQEAGRQEVINA